MNKPMKRPSRPLPLVKKDVSRLNVPAHKRIDAKVRPEKTMKPGTQQHTVLGD